MEDRTAPAAIRSGFNSTSYQRTDDASYSGGIQNLGFTINYFGNTHSMVYVNNNGNITFDAPLNTYTPFNLTSTSREIIAPFFADVDTTTAGNQTQFGTGTVNGHAAFGVTWVDVDYYSGSSSHTNRDSFQVILIDRSDIATGDFDIEFNYDKIQWETGQASGGNSSGLGGNSARAGFSNGTGNSGTFYELTGSAVNGAFLDTNSPTGLINNSLNSSVLGRYIFFARNGTIAVGGVNIVQSGGSTSVTEGGASDTYTVSLSVAPTGNVTVNVSTNSQLNIAPTTLIFTSSNYNSPQTVTVTAVNDLVSQGNRNVVLTHSSTSSDTIYNNLANIDSVTVSIVDDDIRGVAVAETGGSTDVTEGGATDSYSIVLTSQPTASVVVTIGADPQLNLSASTLTFTTANWNVAQIVNVSAVDDSNPTGNRNVTLTHTATSGDSGYDGISVASVVVHITDNEFVGIILQPPGPFSLLEGQSRNYSIRLNAIPTDDVTITLGPDANLSVSASSLVFTPSNWNTAQTVTLTATDNSLADGNRVAVVTHSVTSNDTRYNGFSLPSITVNVIDDENTLIVNGAQTADRLSVLFSANVIQVILNGKVSFYGTNYNQVLILGNAGNDSIVLGAPSIPVAILGGAGTDKVQIDGTSAANTFAVDTFGVTLNGINVNLGDVETVFLNGKNGADFFALQNPTSYAVTLQGGGGSDSLVGLNETTTWKITGADSGNLGPKIAFTSIENLTGGTADDTFVFAKGKFVSGQVDGGGGNNTLDYSAYTSGITANLRTAAVTGTRGFQNIGTIAGGKGADTLVGADASNTWDLTSAYAGTLNTLAFSSFENLTGGGMDDQFVFADGQTFKGKIDGGGGTDSLDYSAFASAVTVNLQAKTAQTAAGWLKVNFLNVEDFVGGSATNTMIGANQTNNWTLTGTDAGSVAAATFQNFANLTGGNQKDTFDLSAGGDWTGLVDGMAGVDTLIAAAGGQYVSGAANAGTLNGNAFRSIENRQ